MRRMRVGLVVTAVMLLGFAAWRVAVDRSLQPPTPSDPVEPAPGPVSAEPRTRSVDLATVAESEGRASQVTASTEQRTPESTQSQDGTDPSHLAQLARAIRDDIGKLKEFKLLGTGLRLVKYSTFLREDVLGRSWHVGTPRPAHANLNEGYAMFNGPSGQTRVYSFPPTENPFYWEICRMEDQHGNKYDTHVEPELLDRIVSFAEESLAMVPNRER